MHSFEQWDLFAPLAELRRLNDLIEVVRVADIPKIEKSGDIVAAMAEKVCMSAADVIGKGLGAVIVGSVALVLIDLGLADAAKAISSAVKSGP